MREIKFRVVNKTPDKHEGIIIAYEYLTETGWKNTLLNNGKEYDDTFDDIFFGHKVALPRNQFTGLKDKNEREIYEGDVVRILYTDWPSKSNSDPRTLEQYLIDISIVGKIVFDVYEWRVEFSEDSSGRIMPGTHGQITVIGNIYESPSLLPTTDKK